MKKFVNMLTIARIIATFILPFLWRVSNPAMLLVFVSLILLTDFFDGLLARTFHVQSVFGTIMDAVADKCFGIMIILILCTYNSMFILALILELGIALINIFGSVFGAVTKSSFLGKVKMWFLGIAIFFGILNIYSSEILNIVTIKPLYDLFNILVVNIDSLIFSSVFLTAGSEFMVAIDYSRHIMKDLNKKNIKIKYKLKSHDELMHILFDTEYALKHKDEPFAKQLFEN